MKTPVVNALGEYYFESLECPIAVKRLRAAEVEQHEHDLTGIPHRHDFSELVIVNGGKSVQVLDGETIPVRSGEVFLLRGGAEHYFPERGKVNLINIQFDAGKLAMPEKLLRTMPGYNVIFNIEPAMRNRRSRRRFCLDPRELAEVEAMSEKLEHELRMKSPGYAVRSYLLLLEIILFLSMCMENEHRKYDSALFNLGKIISLLEEEFSKPWPLKKLSARFGCSPNTLLRRFRAATGQSPIEYLISIRLRHGAKLLHSSSLSIFEIAEKCGFKDSNYFSRQFKKRYGLAPRAFRGKE